MTREEAIKKFKAEQYERFQGYLSDFQKKLEEQIPIFIEQLLNVFHELRIRLSEEQEITYFNFSILRSDILDRKYRVLIECMGEEWFQDPGTVSLYMPMDYLLKGINELWDSLIDASRPYMGKITQYDIYQMICDTIMKCGGYIASIMRMTCWDIEENPDFKQIRKNDVWSILWGEYRGDTQLICHGDYVKKTRKDWDIRFMQLEQKTSIMMNSFWYQASLESYNCSEKDFSFATFNSCILENMDFSNSNLSGARFLNCQIRNCTFYKADLRMTKFIDCKWENSTFEQANMKYTVCSKEGIPIEEFSKEQWETMLILE